MLQWDEATLANLILHEMTHATIYFKGQTDFNEQMATFVGNQGAIDFLIEKYGKDSKEVVEAIHNQEDDLLFSQWIDQACQRLSNFYAREISRDEKLKREGRNISVLKEEFREKMVPLKQTAIKISKRWTSIMRCYWPIVDISIASKIFKPFMNISERI